jgi:hypothetical protein
MDLDDRAIERHRLHFNLHDLLALQFLKDSLNHSAFAPPVHPCVDGVPLSQSLGQAPPLAPLLGDIQNRVEHVAVLIFYVPSLLGQAVFDLFELLFGEFHPFFSHLFAARSSSVNTP